VFWDCFTFTFTWEYYIFKESKSQALCNISKHAGLLRCGAGSRPTSTQAEGPPLVGCLRLITKYIRSDPLRFEAFPSIYHQTMRQEAHLK
jgi:hypothetical protein